jgi:hypothetical protein
VRVIYLTGLSAGGYGAQLNLSRVRAAFPEAKVHLLADSAPMIQPAHHAAWASEWSLPLPDAGFPDLKAWIDAWAAGAGSRENLK